MFLRVKTKWVEEENPKQIKNRSFSLVYDKWNGCKLFGDNNDYEHIWKL